MRPWPIRSKTSSTCSASSPSSRCSTRATRSRFACAPTRAPRTPSRRRRPTSAGSRPRSSQKIQGIGKSTAAKIRELLEGGKVEKLEELREKHPAERGRAPAHPGARAEGGEPAARRARRAVARRPAPGPRRAQGCATSRASARSRRRRSPQALARLEEQGALDRTPISVALPLAERIVARMLEVPGVTHASYCGSLRRFSETIGDVDVVVAATRGRARHGGARLDELRRSRARPRRREDERRHAPRNAGRPARRREAPARRRAPLLHRLEGAQHQAAAARARARLDAQRVRALRDRGRQGHRQRDRGGRSTRRSGCR